MDGLRDPRLFVPNLLIRVSIDALALSTGGVPPVHAAQGTVRVANDLGIASAARSLLLGLFAAWLRDWMVGIQEGLMDEAEAAKLRMMSCVICGESTITVPATALLTVRAPSGRTGVFAAHGQCIIGVFHPSAQKLLDASPVIAEPE